MENNELSPHASVLSRSALHVFITGPNRHEPLPKSSFNPYRKRQRILSLVSLQQIEEALEGSDQVLLTTGGPFLSESALTLSGTS